MSILYTVYCSHCGQEYKVSGDYLNKRSQCCNQPLVKDQRAVYKLYMEGKCLNQLSNKLKIR